MNRTKSFLVVAGFSLALALIFSCSSGGSGEGDEPAVSSSSDESSSSLARVSSSSEKAESSSSGEEASSSSEEASSSSGEASSSSGEASSSSEVVVVGDSSSSEAGGSSSSLSSSSSEEVIVHKCGTGDVYNPAIEQCCENSKYTIATHFCLANKIYSKCGGSDAYDPTAKFCQGGTILKDLCGTETYTASQFCQSPYVVKNLCSGEEYPATQKCHYDIIKPFFIDDRDNKEYVYVTIGTQTWMAENLNHVMEDGSSRCYSNNAENCVTHGRLYNWETAMNNALSSDANPSGVEGVCPGGWHLPSDAEWNALLSYVHSANGETAYASGDSDVAGKYLKATRGWNAHATYGGGQDTYGFAALPGGYYNSIYSSLGQAGEWWSSSMVNVNNSFYRTMLYSGEKVERKNQGKSNVFSSVRCVKNSP